MTKSKFLINQVKGKNGRKIDEKGERQRDDNIEGVRKICVYVKIYGPGELND